MEASILQIGVHSAQWVENISEMNVARYLIIIAGKSLSEALLFAEHEEKMF